MKCIEDEIPFELPEGWEWCRVRDIAAVKGGKRLPKGVGFSPCRTAHAYIRVTDMKNHCINTDDLKYISEEVFLQIKNYTISKDDLYVTIAGTIGVTGEVPTELDGMNLTENAVKITNIQINKNYLCLIIQSEFVQQQFQDKTHQVAMPKLALERILSTLIPVCTITTQSAMVSKFVEMDSLINQIREEKEILAETVSLTKSKILDLAIRGKLVPQNPDDEPASVLLERIRAEKEELIKAGKIKRDKKESIIFKGDDNSYYRNRKGKLVIIDNELPMRIPNTWTWAMLPEIVFFQEGPGILKKDFREKGIPLIRISGLQTDAVSLDGCNYLDPEMVEKKWAHFKLDKGDVILCTSASIGKASIVGDEAVGSIPYTGQIRFKMSDAMDRDYFLYLAISNVYLNQVNAMKTGNCIQHYGPTHLQEVYVPLPPLTEQKRIVTSIKKYINLLDTIESSLV